MSVMNSPQGSSPESPATAADSIPGRARASWIYPVLSIASGGLGVIAFFLPWFQNGYGTGIMEYRTFNGDPYFSGFSLATRTDHPQVWGYLIFGVVSVIAGLRSMSTGAHYRAWLWQSGTAAVALIYAALGMSVMFQPPAFPARLGWRLTAMSVIGCLSAAVVAMRRARVTFRDILAVTLRGAGLTALAVMGALLVLVLLAGILSVLGLPGILGLNGLGAFLGAVAPYLIPPGFVFWGVSHLVSSDRYPVP